MIPLAAAIQWKLTQLDFWKNQKTIRTDEIDGEMQLTDWSVDGFPKPSDSTIKAWCDEYAQKGVFESNFDTDLAKKSIYQAFKSTQGGQTILIQYAGLVGQMIDFADFSDISAWAKAALGPDDYSTLNACFIAQGVNLDNY